MLYSSIITKGYGSFIALNGSMEPAQRFINLKEEKHASEKKLDQIRPILIKK